LIIPLILASVAVVLCVIVAYQDFRFREINFLLIIILGFIVGARKFFLTSFLELFLIDFLINAMICIILLAALRIYYLLRKKSFKESIGNGDLLLFLIFALGMDSLDFPINFTFALVFSLIAHILLKSFYLRHQTIPLAGLMCLYLSAFLIIDSFNINLPKIW